jgi:hypothetical protein
MTTILSILLRTTSPYSHHPSETASASSTPRWQQAARALQAQPQEQPRQQSQVASQAQPQLDPGFVPTAQPSLALTQEVQLAQLRREESRVPQLPLGTQPVASGPPGRTFEQTQLLEEVVREQEAEPFGLTREEVEAELEIPEHRDRENG